MKSAMLFVLLFTINQSHSQNLNWGADPNKFGGPNIVASRLEGAWKLDLRLTKRLNSANVSRSDTIEFISDTLAQSQIPKKYLARLKMSGIYLSGFATIKNHRYPFLLTANSGNPQIICFYQNDNSFTNELHYNLFIAVSEDKTKDILFTGGEYNDQSFVAWERVTTATKL